jgi:bifunctional UDP-N-acetylglucosamine pyrophosphorylase/glucosamine-1-phosphate N-acetyltransferase
MKITPVILAAGFGTRMHSDLPKVLHPLLGQPMASYALQSARQATGEQPVMIVGHAAQQVRQVLGEAARYVLQEPQLGTGHAILQAAGLLRGQTDLVLVTTADMPLLRAETLRLLMEAQSLHNGPLTMLTVNMRDSHGFGRVLRAADGRVLAVVEEAQASAEQLAIEELNASVYCFRADWLWGALERIPLSPKGEYYLTDVVGLAVAAGLPVQAIRAGDPDEIIGVNNRLHLAQAADILRRRINEQWMLAGVTLVDPATTYIEPQVQIGLDTVIWPNTHLQGNTRVGSRCSLGPNTIIHNCQLGERVKAFASALEDAVVEDDVDIGPFAHLRKGAHLAQGVHMGNFGEVKDSYLGPGTKMGHFSYIGNATIGSEVNIGAGTITCNYDGVRKNPTEIGEGAFIGSDTMLVAPVKVGAGARTGAGAVVTKDIPAHNLAVGMPARSIRKLEKRE